MHSMLCPKMDLGEFSAMEESLFDRNDHSVHCQPYGCRVHPNDEQDLWRVPVKFLRLAVGDGFFLSCYPHR